MQIHRLSWAGLRIVTPGATLLVDPLESTEVERRDLGPAREPAVPAGPDGAATAALVTHVHDDHFDPAALRRALGGGRTVFCPADMAKSAAEAGLDVRPVRAGESARVGDVAVAAVEAADGVGAHQVSWVVEHGGRRIFHGGDTLWHGCFWKIARLHGPVDIAFLPINGAVIEVSGLKPSGIEAMMTPEQAAAAAAILGARLACPIHYGMFHRPPTYVETRDAVARFRAAAGARGIAVLVAAPGELVPLPNDDPER